ncbi:MAG: deoxyribose-phosphate aldolase [Bacteroidales bacterium]|nr:deoxyribose-phosphate aldolase [Bacteroidales bacterium]
MIRIEEYPYTDAQFKQRMQEDIYSFRNVVQPYGGMDEQEVWRFILGSIDLTTLEGSDNKAVVANLCQKAIDFRDDKRNVSSTAAVCVYPPFVALAKEKLQGTGIRVASVAGAFPAGQSPIEIKAAEVRYAVQQGADEIDMVISRGKFLEGNLQEVFDEIRIIREVCKDVTLKVILETGELKTPNNIYKASQLAILAGADFIKTSTGKIAVNATPEAFVVMMDAIRRCQETTGKKVGIKAAGGISDAETALLYVRMLTQILGKDWLSNRYFRIGASRLANNVCAKIL